MAPTPFSAEQIRRATREGRTYVFRIEAAGKPALVHRLRFGDVTDAGCVLSTQDLDAAGNPTSAPQRAPVTWTELVGHARYPRAATTIRDAVVDVPAGRYEARLYTVVETKDGKRQVTRAAFATSLPGAPVDHVVEVDGSVVRHMTLVSHDPGR